MYIYSRAVNRIRWLKNKVPPAVQWVYLRTWLNGWATHRRMKHTDPSLVTVSLQDECYFCCRATDSIEHLAYCPLIVEFYKVNGIRLIGLSGLLGLYPDDLPDRILVLARLLCVVFLTRNVLVHNHGNVTPITILHELAIHHKVAPLPLTSAACCAHPSSSSIDLAHPVQATERGRG